MKTNRSLQIKMVLIALFTLFSVNIFAQHTVTGTVLDDLGEGAVGVTIREKGTTNGAATDINGKFTITVADQNAVLQVSSIGFTKQEIKVAGKKTLTIKLVEDRKLLNETVVVGYGTMKKSDVSGSSVTVGEEQLRTSLITSLDQALQGQVAGLQSMQTSGQPGSSSSVIIRGIATINAGTEPLYIIDGVELQTMGKSGSDYNLGDKLGNGSNSVISPLSTIDPSEIVSMEVLKDASACAIYGSKGANGVIIITTKRGQMGAPKITYNGSIDISRQTKKLDMMNLRQYAEYYNSLNKEGIISEANPNYADPSILGDGTNWQDAIFHTAIQHSHQVNVQGGNDTNKYAFSGSYTNQEGTIKGTSFERLSLRANIDQKVTSWLDFGTSVSFSSTSDDLKLVDSNEGLMYYTLTTTPSIPIYNIDGSYSSISQEGYTSPNPIANSALDENKLNRKKFYGNVFTDIKIIKGLKLHSELGWDLEWADTEIWRPTLNLGTFTRDKNESSFGNKNNKYWNVKNYITYSKEIDKHRGTIMFGNEFSEYTYKGMSIANTGLPSDEVHSPALGSGTQSFNNYFGSGAQASFFGRLTYSYDERYNLTATVRYDGSSTFGPNHRWGTFPSFAAGWRFNNESFLESIKDWLSNGKLRFGWGITGNSQIDAFSWGVPITKMESDLGISYRPARIANKDIHWEPQTQVNIGLDLGFFNNRITFTGEWYNRVSNELLMPMQVPNYMGINENTNGAIRLAAPNGNFGSIRNRGFEFTIEARPIVGDFEWTISANTSFNRNKLLNLGYSSNDISLKGWGQWSDLITLTNVGESLYNFYGYVCDGVYTSLEDIQNSPKTRNHPANGIYNRSSTVWVGDIKYKDLSGPDGKPDGVIDDYDRTNLGSPFPKCTFGFTNTFRYKNFDLKIFVNGQIGGKNLNYNKIALTSMKSVWANQLNEIANRAQITCIDPTKDYSAGVDRGDGTLIYNWYDDITNVEVSNPGVSLPRAKIGDSDNTIMSDRYIEDATYVRLKNITLGYTLPKDMLKKTPIESVRIQANIQNLWTITNYTGYDPEIGRSTTSKYVYNCDNGRYPSPTTYSFGVNVTF